MPKLCILVLGCASGPYVDLVGTIRRTWGGRQIAGVDIYYVFGLPNDDAARAALSRLAGAPIPPLADGGIADMDGVLVTGCPDSIFVQEDCILHKRLIAFDFLAATRRYDFIHTVCAASYIDQYELVGYVDRLAKGCALVSGAVSIDQSGRTPFVSGASMLLSAEIAGHLGRHRADIVRQNDFGFRDDVAMGHWIAEHMSSARKEDIMGALRSRHPLPQGSVFVINSSSTKDYVGTDGKSIRPRRGVFHYHFHSKAAQDMADFHERYFLHQTRRLWTDSHPLPERA